MTTSVVAVALMSWIGCSESTRSVSDPLKPAILPCTSFRADKLVAASRKHSISVG